MRPDPIAALAEAWGREIDAYDDTAPSGNPAGRAIGRHEAAIAKRARRAAERAEDERRTAEGRSRELNQPWRRGPMGLWDWTAVGQPVPSPQWRIRSRERRALPGMERPWSLSKQPRIKGLSLGWVRRIDAKRVRLAELAWSEHAGVPCDPR